MAPATESRSVNLHSLLQSGKFSDLKLLCEGHEFAVHKAILCAQSRVFSAECEGGFEESRTNIIKIEEFDADTVQRMLYFLYTGDYTVPQETVSFNRGSGQVQPEGKSDGGRTFSPDFIESDNESVAVTKKDILGWHLRTNAIGDYYDIQPLCAVSRSRLKSEMNKNWSPVQFLHLVMEACSTRKTGDMDFYRNLGQIMGDHLEDLDDIQALDALDIPGALLTSTLAFSVERMRSLQQIIEERDVTIQALEQSKSAVEAQVSMAHSIHGALSRQSECRNTSCSETFPCYIEQNGSGYTLRCSRCLCRQ